MTNIFTVINIQDVNVIAKEKRVRQFNNKEYWEDSLTNSINDLARVSITVSEIVGNTIAKVTKYPSNGNLFYVNCTYDDNRKVNTIETRSFKNGECEQINEDYHYNDKGFLNDIHRVILEPNKIKGVLDISRYEYTKLDAKGNWTECIIKDKGDNVIEKYTRQIFYPK